MTAVSFISCPPLPSVATSVSNTAAILLRIGAIRLDLPGTERLVDVQADAACRGAFRDDRRGRRRQARDPPPLRRRVGAGLGADRRVAGPLAPLSGDGTYLPAAIAASNSPYSR